VYRLIQVIRGLNWLRLEMPVSKAWRNESGRGTEPVWPSRTPGRFAKSLPHRTSVFDLQWLTALPIAPDQTQRLELLSWRTYCSSVENEFMRRGYLLPFGSKDLTSFKPSLPPLPLPLPGEILAPEHMTVLELADALKQKPYKIIADLMEDGIFANVNQQIPFKAISDVAKKYGYTARHPS
jgi:hypothetical protein